MEGFLILGCLLALPAFFFTALISAVRMPREAYQQIGRTKDGTILCVMFTGGVGGLYYWLRIRPELREEAEALGPGV